ncbi:PstS family phosphate ABC transporter substrate-binding protein [Kamptonema cortianum]|uniref:Phosphate-binding protein n=1 Tax=Geitlerinema calcuttense NRMC-F 0142 TaxID=2922238 RepID=A0ABT7LYN9_9CYAN|nr:PstS family phosphate ABC transporter substrate-binding protein [Geitlerinema calcuttense]MDK3158260.1 PstS family phosphate ABC transporter substrate-binding protein [Kamptonema cortianum]MDL5056520.1 PstS family phosphate ABC transporter substrate-binding protein [Geitlerinema calcuttense NRMC-F 0142]
MVFSTRTQLLGAIALMISACVPAPEVSTQAITSTNLPAVSTPEIEIDGSSTVFPVTQAVAAAFQQTEKGSNAQLDLRFSGTGGGFKKFCAGETDINNASRPISEAEILACREAGVRFVELPIAFDALTLVVNPQNTWAQDITVDELKTLWQPAAQGQIKTWQQIRPSYPNRPINLYGAGLDSGTYDYFAEVVVGSGQQTRKDFTASEDDNLLVSGVANDPNAIGFFGYSYYEQNQDKLKALAINNVSPQRETVENAEYQPFARPLFIYVNYLSAQNNPAVKEFVNFYLKNGSQISEQVGYIPLPEEAYNIGLVHFFNGEVGTAFEGKPQPNLTIGELLRKEQAF